MWQGFSCQAFDEFLRCKIGERRMRAHFIVVDEPEVGGIAHFRQIPEGVHVEKLIANARVERFDPGILVGLTRIDEVQVDLMIADH